MAQRPLSVLVVEDHPTIAREVVDFLAKRWRRSPVAVLQPAPPSGIKRQKLDPDQRQEGDEWL